LICRSCCCASQQPTQSRAHPASTIIISPAQMQLKKNADFNERKLAAFHFRRNMKIYAEFRIGKVDFKDWQSRSLNKLNNNVWRKFGNLLIVIYLAGFPSILKLFG
jgi:hypothetical protein